MPNTDPINDHASVTQFILKRAAEASLARVYPIGAVSIGSKGEQLTEIGDLRAAGCVAISDDGRPVATALLMRRALEYASMFGMPVIDHCEDPSLKGDGVAHEGAVAGAARAARAFPARPSRSWSSATSRMAELTGGHVHIAHMSARQSLRAVRAGKERGVAVTGEVTPHHFVLTDEALAERGGYDTNFKMNPPLREEADRDGDDRGPARRIDRRHRDRPRAASRRREGARVRPRAVRHRRPRDGGVALPRSARARRRRSACRGSSSCCRRIPARVLGVPGGTLAEGGPADLTILAPDATVDDSRARASSRSRRTRRSTAGRCKGAVAATIVGGRVVYREPGRHVRRDDWSWT